MLKTILIDSELSRDNLVTSLVADSEGFSDAGFIEKLLLYERTIHEPRLTADGK
jgi:hypothetical protein